MGTWNDFSISNPAYRPGYAFSTDGGTTWSTGTFNYEDSIHLVQSIIPVANTIPMALQEQSISLIQQIMVSLGQHTKLVHHQVVKINHIWQ